MATITVTRDPAGDVPKGEQFSLKAAIEGATAKEWRWQRNGEPVHNGNPYEAEATTTEDSGGTFVAVAILDSGDEKRSEEVKVVVAAEAPSPEKDPKAEEKPPEWHFWFALGSAVLGLLLGVALLSGVVRLFGGFEKAEFLGDSGVAALATTVALSLTTLGAVLVLLGAWMAAVEWRGRFAPKPAKGEGAATEAAESGPLAAGFGEIIEKAAAAIKDLRGAALVMTVGVILMLGAAWVGQSAVSEEETDEPPTGETDEPPAGETDEPPGGETDEPPAGETESPDDGTSTTDGT